jgi:hypothetical protein
MPKTHANEASEPSTMILDTPKEELFCTIMLLVSSVYNGHSYCAGTGLGGVPYEVARKMVAHGTAQMVGGPGPKPGRPPRKTGVEHEVPEYLDSNVWAPASPNPGQRSHIFINQDELDALKDR